MLPAKPHLPMRSFTALLVFLGCSCATMAQIASGPLQTYYTNDFSSSLNGASLSGSAALTAGSVHLTSNVINELGGMTIPASGINADKYHVEFTLSTSQPAGSGADGMSYSFGDDVSATSTAINVTRASHSEAYAKYPAYTIGITLHSLST